jgi:hypothetical protein
MLGDAGRTRKRREPTNVVGAVVAADRGTNGFVAGGVLLG